MEAEKIVELMFAISYIFPRNLKINSEFMFWMIGYHILM